MWTRPPQPLTHSPATPASSLMWWYWQVTILSVARIAGRTCYWLRTVALFYFRPQYGHKLHAWLEWPWSFNTWARNCNRSFNSTHTANTNNANCINFNVSTIATTSSSIKLDKSKKRGIKLFVLCGHSYQFKIYNGARDNIMMPGTPHPGVTNNIVVRLYNSKFQESYRLLWSLLLYVPLLVYLRRARVIFSLGTKSANRIPNCKLPLNTDREIKNVTRQDTNNVQHCSTSVEKWYSTTKKIKNTLKSTTFIICEYNSHMGGVDHMDSYIAVTNALILYRRSTA